MKCDVELTAKVESRILVALIKAFESGCPLDEVSIAEQAGVATDVVRAALGMWGLRGRAVNDDVLLGLVEDVVLRSGRLEEVPRAVGWKFFERLVGRLLARTGLEVAWNVRLSLGKSRFQFDLIAIGNEALYVIECKRWHRTLSPSLRSAISSQLLRRVEAMETALKSVLGEGNVTVYVVPTVITPHARPSGEQVFFASLRALRSLVSEHPSTLDSPPVRRLQVASRPSFPVFHRRPFSHTKVGKQ